MAYFFKAYKATYTSRAEVASEENYAFCNGCSSASLAFA